MAHQTPQWPHPRRAEECMTANMPDIFMPPSGMADTEMFCQLRDYRGEISPCQHFWNAFMACRRANPISYDVTMVCRKLHEDYVECTHGTKNFIRGRKAKELWRDYEKAKYEGNLRETVKFRPIFTA